jgi:hypothetical protein
MQGSGTIALIILVLGLILLIHGMKELYQVNKFGLRGKQADGIIVEMKKGPGIGSKYHPYVRFQTKEGKIVEFSPGNGSNPPMYRVGDHVPVVYNSDYPNYAVINSFIEIWLGPLIYTGLGLLLLFSFGFQWVKSKSKYS